MLSVGFASFWRIVQTSYGNIQRQFESTAHIIDANAFDFGVMEAVWQLIRDLEDRHMRSWPPIVADPCMPSCTYLNPTCTNSRKSVCADPAKPDCTDPRQPTRTDLRKRERSYPRSLNLSLSTQAFAARNNATIRW